MRGILVPCGYRDAVSDARGDFRHGAELWNRGLYFEAHEAFEGPWRAAERHTPRGRLFQGLILLAAAAVKHERGASATARRLAARGARAIAASTAAPPFAPAFAAAVESWVGGGRPGPPSFDTSGPP
jgi:predicted metal-dependent hydrolase